MDINISSSHKQYRAWRMDECSRLLHQLLTQESLVASLDEAYVIVDSLRQEKEGEFCSASSERKAYEGIVRYALREYFDLEDREVTKLLHKYSVTVSGSEDTPQADSDSDDDDANSANQESSAVDDEKGESSEEQVGPGECELCERDVNKLTRHHLIPRSTWNRTKPMILSQWNKSISIHATRHSIDSNEFDHLLPILLNLSESVPSCKTLRGRQATAGSRIIRDVLSQQTIDICRPCHDHIHRSYDNRTLSVEFNTLDKLLNNETIAKYAKWANRQHRYKIRGSSK